MKRSNRTLWVILLGIPALLVLPVAIVGSSMVTAGSIELEVHGKHGSGSHIGMTIPAGIIPIACHLMPSVVIDDIRLELDEEARYALRIVEAVMDELRGVPDGVFVEVMDGTDIVTIEKVDGNLKIFVDTPDETVRLSIPIGTISHVIRAIDFT